MQRGDVHIHTAAERHYSLELLHWHGKTEIAPAFTIKQDMACAILRSTFLTEDHNALNSFKSLEARGYHRKLLLK